MGMLPCRWLISLWARPAPVAGPCGNLRKQPCECCACSPSELKVVSIFWTSRPQCELPGWQAAHESLGGKRMRLVTVKATQAFVDAGRSAVVAGAKLAEGVGGMALDAKPLARVGRYLDRAIALPDGLWRAGGWPGNAPVHDGRRAARNRPRRPGCGSDGRPGREWPAGPFWNHLSAPTAR